MNTTFAYFLTFFSRPHIDLCPSVIFSVSVEDDKATCVPSTSASTAQEPGVSTEVSRPSGPTLVPPSVSTTASSSTSATPILTAPLPPSQPAPRRVKAARQPTVPVSRVPQKRTAVVLSEEPQPSTSAASPPASPGDVSQPAQPGPSSPQQDVSQHCFLISLSLFTMRIVLQ